MAPSNWFRKLRVVRKSESSVSTPVYVAWLVQDWVKYFQEFVQTHRCAKSRLWSFLCSVKEREKLRLINIRDPIPTCTAPKSSATKKWFPLNWLHFNNSSWPQYSDLLALHSITIFWLLKERHHFNIFRGFYFFELSFRCVAIHIFWR